MKAVVDCVELLEVMVVRETVVEGEGKEREGGVEALGHSTALPLLLGAGLGVPRALGVALGEKPGEAVGMALSVALAEWEAAPEALGVGVAEGVAHKGKDAQGALLELAPGLGLAAAETTLEVVEEEVGVGVGALPVGATVAVGVVAGVQLGASLALSAELALQAGVGGAPEEELALKVHGEVLEMRVSVGQTLAVQQLLLLDVLLALPVRV